MNRRRPTRYAGGLPSPAELATIYGDVPDPIPTTPPPPQAAKASPSLSHPIPTTPPPPQAAKASPSLSHLDWFEALACFKSTATWSLIVKHNRRRPEPDPDLDAMAAVLPHLLDRARALLTR
jgi:hypothetical protein